MPTMPLLNWWKARAQARVERLKRALSAPLPPGAAYGRSIRVKRLLTSMNAQKEWLGALDQQIEQVREALEGAGSSGASASKTKTGSLGD